MFQGWGFLLAEVWGLIAAAGVLGLFAGWLIWGGRETVPQNGLLSDSTQKGGAVDRRKSTVDPAGEDRTRPAVPPLRTERTLPAETNAKIISMLQEYR